MTADKLKRLMSMVGRKFLTAAIVAARITGVKGVRILVEKPEESYAMMLYGTATEVGIRVQETYENGLGLVDWIVLFILMVSWELMVVEKLREKIRCPCKKRKKERRVVCTRLQGRGFSTRRRVVIT